MAEEGEYEYFKLRKEARTYITKVFAFGVHNDERVRNVRQVFENGDDVQLGEVEGSMCLRVGGLKRKVQVVALVTQDHKENPEIGRSPSAQLRSVRGERQTSAEVNDR